MIAQYDQKKIFAIGKVVFTMTCDYVNGVLVTPGGTTQMSMNKGYQDRIIDAINTSPYPGLAIGSKFMLVDEFVCTDFLKTSFGPMRFKRYFNLADYIDNYSPDLSVKDIAAQLDGKTWD